MDKGKRFNTDLLEAVELGFLLELAEVLVVSAKARNESRGGHFREDYPTRDDVNFMQHTMAYRDVDSDGRAHGPPGLQAGRADPIRADGAQVLMTTTETTSKETVRRRPQRGRPAAGLRGRQRARSPASTSRSRSAATTRSATPSRTGRATR